MMRLAAQSMFKPYKLVYGVDLIKFIKSGYWGKKVENDYIEVFN